MSTSISFGFSSSAVSSPLGIHASRHFLQNPVWKDIFDTTWSRHKSRFSKHITRMASRLDLVTRRATIVQFNTLQNTSAMEDERIRTELENEDLMRRQAVFTWSKPIEMDSEQYHLEKIRAQYPGTGRWLLDHQTFKEWFDPQLTTLPTLLWLHGNPGAG